MHVLLLTCYGSLVFCHLVLCMVGIISRVSAHAKLIDGVSLVLCPGSDDITSN